MAGRLELNRRGRLSSRPGGRVQAAARHLRQPGAARARGLLRAVDLRLPDPGRRAAGRRLPGRPAEVPDHRRGHQDHLVGQLGRQPRRRQRDGPPRPDRREGPPASPRTRSGSSSSRPSCSTCRGSASTASTRRAWPPARPARSTSAPRTASSWSTRTGAAAGGSASPAARTRRSTSTTRPARPRSARSATRASRSGCRRSARRPASGRLRYLGLFLYDADRVTAAAADAGRQGPLRGAARPDARPDDPEVDRRGPARRHPRRLDGRGPALAGLRAGQEVPGGAAAAPGVPHHADGLVRPAAVADRRPARATRATTPRTATYLFGAIEALRIPVEYLAELFTAGRHRHRHRRAAASSPRCASYMRDVTLGRDGDPSRSPRPSGMTERVAVRDVPAHGDRQVRRPLRHPDGPRRAGPRPRGDGLLARLRRGAGHVRVRPVRRGQRTAGPGRRRDLQRAQAAADLRRRDSTPAESSCAAGSTCSTGTAVGAPVGLFPGDARTEAAP